MNLEVPCGCELQSRGMSEQSLCESSPRVGNERIDCAKACGHTQREQVLGCNVGRKTLIGEVCRADRSESLESERCHCGGLFPLKQRRDAGRGRKRVLVLHQLAMHPLECATEE